MRHITRPLVQRNRTWNGQLLPDWTVTWPTLHGHVRTTRDTWDEALALANALAKSVLAPRAA